MAHKEDWLVIGIGGVTCAGKTTLAARVRRALCPSYVLHQDTYFHPDDWPGHVKCDGLDHNDYDILSSLDMPRMHQDILRLLNGDSSDMKVDVSLTAQDPKNAYTVPKRKVLVVEGFSILNYPDIYKLCDLKYYVTLELGECAMRRSMRVYNPPDVAGYFDVCVWPRAMSHRKELERDASVRMLDGTQGESLLDAVLNDLRHYGLQRVAH